jgi:hypothetical protein
MTPENKLPPPDYAEAKQPASAGCALRACSAFGVSFRRICDGDPTKYGPAWGIYEWTIGNVTVQRHCHDGESPLQQLARILTDPRLKSRLSRFDMQNDERIPHPASIPRSP